MLFINISSMLFINISSMLFIYSHLQKFWPPRNINISSALWVIKKYYFEFLNLLNEAKFTNNKRKTKMNIILNISTNFAGVNPL